MRKFAAPVILLVLTVGVIAYLFMDLSKSKSSFDADAYLKTRAQIDSLEMALWESADKPDLQLTIRKELEASWDTLNAMRSGPSAEEQEPSALSGESKIWVAVGVALVIVCVILLFALVHRRKVLTQKLEAIKRDQRFKEPKNGFENDPTILAPRPHPQKKSIIDEVVGEPVREQKIAFEDENGIPENKILSEDLDGKPTLRPTAKERITSAMQSLSDVLRAPRGVTRDRTMKIRAQSHNTTGDPNLQKKPSPLKTSRFDREFTAKSKILQMSRRGFPASAIATQLGVPQDQVEAVIREALDSGN
ncbi:MAG: hypothetical protein IKX42_12695 [Fibrobacter sp.]|nr:hypothetical protein [Fibrobacter sp.]